MCHDEQYNNILLESRKLDPGMSYHRLEISTCTYKKEKYPDENEYRLLISYFGEDSERRAMQMNSKGLIRSDF